MVKYFCEEIGLKKYLSRFLIEVKLPQSDKNQNHMNIATKKCAKSNLILILQINLEAFDNTILQGLKNNNICFLFVNTKTFDLWVKK